VPYSLTFTEASTALVLVLPRPVLAADRILPEPSTGPIAANSPALRMLTTLADEATRQGAALDSGVREELGQNAVELLRSATRPVEREVAQTSGHTIFLAVRRAMLLHARDPDFTIADAAALAHVSLRYAQKLFEREGVRMSTFLRTRRLQEAAALLESGTQARSVEAVAHLAGFADVNTFIRAFAREYGTTPAKWRRERQG
jgi:AraC-like DNA-binding protein